MNEGDIFYDCVMCGGPKDGWVYGVPKRITQILLQECSESLAPVATWVYKRIGDTDRFYCESSIIIKTPAD